MATWCAPSLALGGTAVSAGLAPQHTARPPPVSSTHAPVPPIAAVRRAASSSPAHARRPSGRVSSCEALGVIVGVVVGVIDDVGVAVPLDEDVEVSVPLDDAV